MNNYFYIDLEGTQHGPLPLSQLITDQCLYPETMVWNSTLVEWQRADGVDELIEHLTTATPMTDIDTPPPRPFSDIDVDRRLNGHNSHYQHKRTPQKPETWLVWNILSTVMCCSMIPGIIGVIYSNKVDNLWAMGQYSEGVRAANTAKTMFLLSLGLYILAALCITGVLISTAGLTESAHSLTINGIPFIESGVVK